MPPGPPYTAAGPRRRPWAPGGGAMAGAHGRYSTKMLPWDGHGCWQTQQRAKGELTPLAANDPQGQRCGVLTTPWLSILMAQVTHSPLPITQTPSLPQDLPGSNHLGDSFIQVLALLSPPSTSSPLLESRPRESFTSCSAFRRPRPPMSAAKCSGVHPSFGWFQQ